MSNILNDSGFKDTPLGPLPVEWDMTRIGNIFRPVTIKLRDYRGFSDVPILSMTRSQGLILQSEKFDKRIASKDIGNYKVITNGQLAYGFPIDEGVIAVLHRYPIGAVSPAYHVWQPIQEIDLTFIDYLLKIPELIQVYQMHSSNVVQRRRNLSPKDFIEIEIPLPPLPEQRAIAHVLSTVRQAIEASQRVIAAAQAVKRSLMKHLFTYGPVALGEVDQVKMQETEFGESPADWKVVKLGEFANIVSGGTPSRNKPEYWNGEIPWVKTGEINYHVITKTEELITEQGYKNSSARRIPPGTILIAMYGNGATRGRVAILGIEAAINQACAAILLTETISSDFLFHYLSHKYDLIRALGHGAHQKNISAMILKTIPITVPTDEVQDKISRRLSILDNKIICELKRKTALESLFTSLLHHLMTGRLRLAVGEPGGVFDPSERSRT